MIYGMKPWDLWDETNKSPLKMDGWQTIRLPFGALNGLFSAAFAVSFREGIWWMSDESYLLEDFQ